MEKINEMANIPHIGQRFRNHYGVFIPDLKGNYKIYEINRDQAMCALMKSPGAGKKLNVLPNGLLTSFRLKPFDFYKPWNAVFIPAKKTDPHRIKIAGTFPNFFLPDGRQVWMTPQWFQLTPFDYINAMMLERQATMYRAVYTNRNPDVSATLQQLPDGRVHWRTFLNGALYAQGEAPDDDSARYCARRSFGRGSNNSRRLRFA